MKKTILLIAIICAWGITAQETETIGPIITDRPDQTESPNLIPKGFFQVETGFAYGEAETENFWQKTTTYNTSLFRYGLLDNLELRLGFDIAEMEHVSKTFPGSNTGSGLSPLYTGLKIGVAKEKGILPEIGFLGGVFLPFTAADAFKTEGTGGDFRLAFSHTLSEKWGFSYNFGAAWNGENPFVSYVYSAVFGYAITDKLSAFAEVYGDFPENTSGNHLIDGGLTYLLTDNMQVDLAGGTGLNTEQEFFIGAGFSVRLPH